MLAFVSSYRKYTGWFLPLPCLGVYSILSLDPSVRSRLPQAKEQPMWQRAETEAQSPLALSQAERGREPCWSFFTRGLKASTLKALGEES